MSVKFATCLLMSMLASWAQADNCSFEEKQKLKLKHQKCTEVVQQRYSLLTVETPSSRKEVSTPLALKTNSGLEKEYVCRMIEETIDNCARIYDKCFNEKEMRLFQDSQLRIISEIMGQVYNMGAVVDECDIMMEFKSSGREGLVLPTEKCTLPQVEAISARYQECIEGANDMMNRRIVVQSSVDTIFSVLCDGMDKIVHGCSQVLEKCYTDEEIMETKIGQLELTRKIFDDIMTVKKGQKSSMVLDMNQCNAYSSLGYFTSNASSSLLQQSSILFTLLTTLLVLL